MAEAVVGKYFDSYESVKCFVKDYEQSKCVQLSVKSSHKIKLCKPNVLQLKMANVNMDLVYSMIEYKCVHGGEYKSNGNGQRKTKTLKQGCPFVMKINLSPDAQKLRISRLEECHNHEISKETFRSLPKQRLSLDERQRGSIQEMLALKCNKKLVKQHIVNVMDKDVTLRDIHNMKPKNSNSLEETVNYLKSLGGYVEVLAIEGKLEGIFYQDSRMRNAFSANPHVLLLDATYCLNNLYMPLYILMVINGNGQGQVAALFILAHETSSNITKMLNIFRQKNASSDSTKIIFTDKDFSEREAVRQTFPGTNLLLCFFHTLKTFRSKVAKMGLSNDNKKKALHTLQSIAYSKNEIDYEEHHAQLLNLKIPQLTEYYEKNWHPIRYEWVRGFIKMEKTFSITTTNHLESLNNKIKQVVARNSNLLSFFKDLLTALDSIHGEQKSRAINMVLKQSTEHEKGSIEEYYESCLTPYAWNLVCGEIEAAKNMAFCFEATASPETCGCSFFINTSLPCRHIFFKRSDAGLPLAAGILIPLRFSKEKHMSLYSCNLDRNEEPPTCTITSLPMPKKTKIMNKQEKYKKAMELFGDIANILSDYGTEKFSSTLKKLETFKDMLIKNPDNNNILDQETGVEEEGVAEVELVGESEEVLDVELVSEEGTMEMVGGEEGVLEVEMVGEEEVLDKEMVGEEEQVVEVVMVGEEVVKVDMIGEDKELVDVVMGGNILQEGQEGVSTIDLKNISIKGMALKRRGRPRGADSTVVGLKRRKLD